MSVSHFTRSFRAIFGVSAHGWLVQRRIDLAKDLIGRQIPARRHRAPVRLLGPGGVQPYFPQSSARAPAAGGAKTPPA